MPPPEVDSAIVALERRPEPLFGAATPGFLDFVKDLFTARRKTVKTALTIGRGGLSSQQAENVVKQAGLDTSIRADTLSGAELFLLYEKLQNAKS
jgi:16S rRNA (adenine1518-N6/adenine1519-N6)-dimethyltransferase